jgi:hypothetical protein
VSGPDIFISYCRQERAAARVFAESFAEEGFKVWWDAVLHSGETFDEVIERELRAAKTVVVLWSPRSVVSRWVRAEATQADRLNKLVPVMIEGCTLPIIFELTHTADLSDWKGDRSDGSWQSLISDLRRHIGPAEELASAKPVEESKPEPAATHEPAPYAPEPPGPAAPGSEDVKSSSMSRDELIEALERQASSKRSALQDPTPIEEAQAKFFKRSDEYRHSEGELVHCLRRIYGPESEPLYVVTPIGLKIGRMKPADIIVSEPGVSREHCLVEFAADRLRVTDLNSTNGTYIDDKRIGHAELLPVGSTLRVGNVSFGHEVRSRSEMEQPDGPIGFNLGTGSRESRIAGSS